MVAPFHYQGMFIPGQVPFWFVAFAPFLVLDLCLKAWALWRAARMNKLGWFVVLAIINSVGILPVIFLVITNEEYKKNEKLRIENVE